jgi:hypothetical protein
MTRSEPIRIETMPMRGTDQEGRLLREGTRHLIYRGPLRIGEIEETTAVHESGQQYGLRPGLAAMCLPSNADIRQPCSTPASEQWRLQLRQLNTPSGNGWSASRKANITNSDGNASQWSGSAEASLHDSRRCPVPQSRPVEISGRLNRNRTCQRN